MGGLLIWDFAGLRLRYRRRTPLAPELVEELRARRGEILERLEAEARSRVPAETPLGTATCADCGERWPYQLSGGQRQRIGIARALAVEPDILLMDEPFGALDAITRTGMQDELLRIWSETKKSVLFVTHDIEEAVYLGDRVLLLGGKPAEIVKEYHITMDRSERREGEPFMRQVDEVKVGLHEAIAMTGNDQSNGK